LALFVYCARRGLGATGWSSFLEPEAEFMRKSSHLRRRIILLAVATVVAAGGWVTWREVWGRPLWVEGV
jgi:hypothetical protein